MTSRDLRDRIERMSVERRSFSLALLLGCLLSMQSGCTDSTHPVDPLLPAPGGDSPPGEPPAPSPPPGDPSPPFSPNQGSARLHIADGYDPAWSPDGTRIAFASTRDGTPAIYIANADGSNSVRLASGSWPAWSPDGQRIAFHREGDFRWGDGEIRVIDVDGSNEAALVRGEFPGWSPDGDRIVFTNLEGISVMNADGSSVTRLLRGDFLGGGPDWPVIGKPAWSHDGTGIAFEHSGDGDITPAQIYVMNADGSGPRRLTPVRGIQFAESDPSWSPDGTRIVFWSYGLGIAVAGTTGGSPITRYKNFPSVHYGARPSWSPDNTIAFTAHRFADGTGPEIWIEER